MSATDGQELDQWHLARNDKTYGPYGFSTLVEAVRKGVLSAEDKVWRPGWGFLASRRIRPRPVCFARRPGAGDNRAERGDTHCRSVRLDLESGVRRWQQG